MLQKIKYLISLLLTVYATTICAFQASDMSSSQYAIDLLEKARKTGFATHLDQQTQAPSTQLEFLVLSARFLQLTNDTVTSSATLTINTDVPAWAENAFVTFEAKFGNISPFFFTEFSPKTPILQAEAAKIVLTYLFADPTYTYNNKLVQNETLFFEKDATLQLKNIGIWPSQDDNSPYISKKQVIQLWLQAAAYKNVLYQQSQKKIAQAQTQSSDISVFRWFEQLQPKIGGSIDLSTHYVARGIKQIDESGVHLIGGLQAVFNNKMYVASQLSPVQLRTAQSAAPEDPVASYEFVNMVGKYFPVHVKNKNLLINVGALYVAYPDIKEGVELNYGELFVSTTFKSITMSFYALAYAQDQQYSFMDDYYFSVSTQHQLIDDLMFNASVGFYNTKFAIQQLETEKKINAVFSLQKNKITLSAILNNQKNDDAVFQLSYKLAQF